MAPPSDFLLNQEEAVMFFCAALGIGKKNDGFLPNVCQEMEKMLFGVDHN